jgi:hypothetical protein
MWRLAGLRYCAHMSVLARCPSSQRARPRLWSHAPDVPPYSQHRLSLALASRRLRSRIQHWTALTIDHHLALDTLVMRRSVGHVGQETLLQQPAGRTIPDMAKPLRCRLRLHNWEHRENPETQEPTRSVYKAYRDRGNAAPGAGAAGVTGTGIG